MKRKIGWLLALVLLFTLLTGCGSSKSAPETNAGGGNFGAMDVEPEEAPMEPAPEEGGPQQTAKLIYRGDLELETTSFEEVTESLLALVESCGGYVESSELHNSNDGYRRANYTVRVPVEQYRRFFSEAGELCHVTWKSEETQNITRQYYDTAGRLTTQQTKLARLQELLRQAETMEDLITIESAISDTEYQIEALSGELRTYDDLVDHSTVTIYLREVYQLSNTRGPAVTFGDRLGNALISGLQGFFDGMADLLVALAYGWVWVLLALIAVILLVRRGRKRRQEGEPRPKLRLRRRKDDDQNTSGD